MTKDNLYKKAVFELLKASEYLDEAGLGSSASSVLKLTQSLLKNKNLLSFAAVNPDDFSLQDLSNYIVKLVNEKFISHTDAIIFKDYSNVTKTIKNQDITYDLQKILKIHSDGLKKYIQESPLSGVNVKLIQENIEGIIKNIDDAISKLDSYQPFVDYMGGEKQYYISNRDHLNDWIAAYNVKIGDSQKPYSAMVPMSATPPAAGAEMGDDKAAKTSKPQAARPRKFPSIDKRIQKLLGVGVDGDKGPETNKHLEIYRNSAKLKDEAEAIQSLTKLVEGKNLDQIQPLKLEFDPFGGRTGDNYHYVLNNEEQKSPEEAKTPNYDPRFSEPGF